MRVFPRRSLGLLFLFGFFVIQVYLDKLDGFSLFAMLEGYFNSPQKYLFLFALFFPFFFLAGFKPFLEPMVYVRLKEKLFPYLVKQSLRFSMIVCVLVFGTHLLAGLIMGMNGAGMSLRVLVFWLRFFLFYLAMYYFASSVYCLCRKAVPAAITVTIVDFCLIAATMGISYFVFENRAPGFLINGTYSIYVAICLWGGLFFLFFKSGKIECL